jgi:ketosteroid isomerase-like protein
MRHADNKRLMQQIFDEMARGNGKALMDALSDDARWTVTGTTRWSRTYEGKRAVMSELMKPLFALFADTYTSTATRLIAEDDIVVVECQGRVTTKRGPRYDNRYCLVCRIVDGRIREITEYLDTELVTAALT